MVQSAWGQGLAKTNQDFLTQYEAQNQRKIAALEQQAAEMERLQREAEEQQRIALEAQQQAYQQQVQQAQQSTAPVQQATPQPQAPTNPLDDENSAIRQHLSNLGISIDTYMGRDTTDDKGNIIKGMSKIEREREVVTPFLETRWEQELRENPELQNVNPETLKRYKTQFMQSKKRLYGVNFDEDYNQNVSPADRLGSVINSGVSGALGVVDSVSEIAKNIGLGESETLNKAIDSAQEGLRTLDDEQRNQLKDYANSLIERGEVAKLAGLVMDYPSLAADVGVQMVGGQLAVKGGLKGASKLAGKVKSDNVVARALDAGARHNMVTTAGIMNAGDTARQLSEDGTEVGVGTALATALSGATGAALALGANRLGTTADTVIERAINRTGANPLAQGSKAAAQKILDARAGGSAAGNVARYGLNTGKGLAKGAAAEGAEEFGQSLSASSLADVINKDGTLGTITDDEMNRNTARATGEAGVGAMFGGLLGGVRHGSNTYGNAEAAQLAQEQSQERARQAVADKKKSSQIEQGIWQDEQGNPLAGFSEDDIAQAQRNAERIRTASELEALYGKELEDAYMSDIDSNEQAGQFNQAIDSTLASVVANRSDNSAIPASVEEATNALASIGTAQGRVQQIQEWAKQTGNTAVEAEAGALAGKMLDGYDYDSTNTYTSKSSAHTDKIKTALNRLQAVTTGTTTDIQDVNAELDMAATTQPALADAIAKYKQASSSGHNNVANRLAEQLERQINKLTKNAPKQTVPDGLSKLARDVETAHVISSIGGSVGLGGRRNTGKFAQDPIAYVEEIANRVGTSPVLTLDEKIAVAEIINPLLDDWRNGNYRGLSRDVLSKDLQNRLQSVK